MKRNNIKLILIARSGLCLTVAVEETANAESEAERGRTKLAQDKSQARA